ncbi:hypothetical protein BpHYR1_026649 [Brachionus plicatilis]|uniref:Uncharacterized protein n=1 Tax=Brachionus plicatilis TaxID=10195 RepID=A0A3M7RN35_BRAPC|nr:hypothetical protein BpHYR1_026649 [Brachionus plicatilis]
MALTLIHFKTFLLCEQILLTNVDGAILQNLQRFCRLLQKVKQQLFHFVSFTEQFCMKFHNRISLRERLR